MSDLFEEAKKYPHAPGYQRRDTSIDAARKVTQMNELHINILDTLRRCGPLTFYEVAEFMNVDSRRVQPRMSELAAQGKIADSGDRHPTPYGRKGIAWKMVPL